ncbi:hypothetical protein BDF14DRAFT_1766048 [Spinellus fusiger]|nr:hypothetical protein BDF14DRAFT_1766048 [Spinellus fusiger]
MMLVRMLVKSVVLVQQARPSNAKNVALTVPVLVLAQYLLVVAVIVAVAALPDVAPTVALYRALDQEVEIAKTEKVVAVLATEAPLLVDLVRVHGTDINSRSSLIVFTVELMCVSFIGADSRRKEKDLHGTRDAPEKSNILGVFGLSLRTRERNLEEVFEKYGNLEKVTVVYDHRSNRSRGFGFITFGTVEEAERARDETNGLEIDERKIRVDFSMTHRPHTPTPGEYMGERRTNDRSRERRPRRMRRMRSRTPERRRRYRSRSRSRSWSR